jgi:hypothetical protein
MQMITKSNQRLKIASQSEHNPSAQDGHIENHADFQNEPSPTHPQHAQHTHAIQSYKPFSAESSYEVIVDKITGRTDTPPE